MDLDDYIILKQEKQEDLQLKELPELAVYMSAQTQSAVDAIKRNLKLEVIFASVFLVFDCVMMIFFSEVFFFRLFTILLLVFCIGFIFYILRLLRFIQSQYKLDNPVNEQLAIYIYIISRFTTLYFQTTIFMVPFMFIMAFLAGYLNQGQSVTFVNVIHSQTILAYFGLACVWSVGMYFFTKWYIRKLYGNHLIKLKEQLRELQEVR